MKVMFILCTIIVFLVSLAYAASIQTCGKYMIE